MRGCAGAVDSLSTFWRHAFQGFCDPGALSVALRSAWGGPFGSGWGARSGWAVRLGLDRPAWGARRGRPVAASLAQGLGQPAVLGLRAHCTTRTTHCVRSAQTKCNESVHEACFAAARSPALLGASTGWPRRPPQAGLHRARLNRCREHARVTRARSPDDDRPFSRDDQRPLSKRLRPLSLSLSLIPTVSISEPDGLSLKTNCLAFGTVSGLSPGTTSERPASEPAAPSPAWGAPRAGPADVPRSAAAWAAAQHAS
jgi:hypothetical protein